MADSREHARQGKHRTHYPVEGWPTVIIHTYRRAEGVLYEDTLQLKTPYPPQLGEYVQGYDGEYSKVEEIQRSYQEQSVPIIYVTCERPS